MKPNLLLLGLGLALCGGCSTQPVVSKSYTQGKLSEGPVYALPRTLISVSVDLEFYVLEGKDANDAVTARQVRLDLAPVDNPVRIESHQVPDWNKAFVLNIDDDALIATEYTLEFEKDGLLKSFNAKADDKLSEVIANSLGAALKIVTMVKADEKPENVFKPTGIRIALHETIPAASALKAAVTLFASQLAPLQGGRDPRLQAVYGDYPVHAVPSFTAAFSADSSAPKAVTSSISPVDKGTPLQRSAGIYYSIPIPRVVVIEKKPGGAVGHQIVSVGDDAPIGFIPANGRRFANVSQEASFYGNTGGAQKIKSTRSSAAAAATASLNTSLGSIQETLTALETAKKTKETEAKTAADAAKTAAETASQKEVTRERELALRRVKLSNLKEKIAQLDAHLAKTDIQDRDAKQQELWTAKENRATLEVEIAALENNRPLPGN